VETSQFTFSQKVQGYTISAAKVMLTIFWDSQGVLLAHFQKHDEDVNCASCCEVLLKLRDAIRRKLPGQL
jgi:hypothetical protein